MLKIFAVDDLADIPQKRRQSADVVAVGMRDENVFQFGQGNAIEPGGSGTACAGIKGVIFVVDFKHTAGMLPRRHGFSSGTGADGVDSHKILSLNMGLLVVVDGIFFQQSCVRRVFLLTAAERKEKTENGKKYQQINEPFAVADVKGSFRIFGQINFNDFRRRPAPQFRTGEFFSGSTILYLPSG